MEQGGRNLNISIRRGIWQNPIPFHNKTLRKVEREKIPQHTKRYLSKTHSKHYSQWYFPLRVGMRQGWSFSPLFHHSTSSNQIFKKNKENKKEKKKNIQIWKVKQSLVTDVMTLMHRIPQRIQKKTTRANIFKKKM